MLIYTEHGAFPEYAASARGAIMLHIATHSGLERSYDIYHDQHRLNICGTMRGWLETTGFDHAIYENGVRLCLVFSEPMEAKLFKLAFNL